MLPSRFHSLLLAAALFALPAAAAAQSSDATTVNVAILDVLKARGIIDQAEYDELLALAREQAGAAESEVDLIEGRLARLRAPDVMVEGGKPGKLEFRSADGAWSMAIKGKMQVRAENYNSDADSGDGSNFSVARAYLGFEGKAGAPNATYKFEFDVPTQSSFNSTSSTKSPLLRDAYINWAFGPLAALRFGQFKVPYGREELMSTFALTPVDRSIASSEFAPAYEPGAMLHSLLGEGMFEYYFGASNGQGAGANNPSGETRNGLRKFGRAVWNITGSPLKARARPSPPSTTAAPRRPSASRSTRTTTPPARRPSRRARSRTRGASTARSSRARGRSSRTSTTAAPTCQVAPTTCTTRAAPPSSATSSCPIAGSWWRVPR